MYQTIALWALLMALPAGAGQEGKVLNGDGRGALVNAVVGVTAGRVIRNVAAQLTGACPSYCVENDLYAVSDFLVLFLSLGWIKVRLSLCNPQACNLPFLFTIKC